MNCDKGILIKNIYYMLSYAFQVLKESNYEGIATEEFENIYDLFAAILGRGIARQLKQGLYREYIEKEEDLSTKRGKIIVAGTIRNKIQKKQRLTCEYDELSENNVYNQILKTTMLVLVRCPDVKRKHVSVLKKELLLFSAIDSLNPKEIRWDCIRFQKNNQEYRMLLGICNMVLEGLILTTDSGDTRMATFLDEQEMCHLYEKFILGYYKYHHPELVPNPDRIDWDIDEGKDGFLPAMQTDITLKGHGRTLIIDAKYYGQVMQSRFEVQTIHSANLYQIYTYVKNLDSDRTRKVSGMLLYAKTQEQVQPNSRYVFDGNSISVKSLDLNLPFSEIADQLEKIVEDYFVDREEKIG